MEWALNEHLPFRLSAGVGGYFYQQVTNDGGQGDERLRRVRGRVASIGPLVSYTLKTPVSQVVLSARWFHEFDVQNRVRGNSIFASMAFPLSPPPPVTSGTRRYPPEEPASSLSLVSERYSSMKMFLASSPFRRDRR